MIAGLRYGQFGLRGIGEGPDPPAVGGEGDVDYLKSGVAEEAGDIIRRHWERVKEQRDQD